MQELKVVDGSSANAVPLDANQDAKEESKQSEVSSNNIIALGASNNPP
jgi:hypothetical protein